MAQKITTHELATLFGVKPLSVLQAHSRKKSYLGLIPRKLPNGQLRWDRDEALSVLNGDARSA